MRRLFPILLLAALSLAACSPAATTTPTPQVSSKPTFSPEQLAISDPAKPIEVAAGSEFTITVQTPRSTNMHWEIVEALDTKVVDYVWKDHVADDPVDPISAGRDIWRFKAVASGQTTITLGNYSGESLTSSQKEVFTIVVK